MARKILFYTHAFGGGGAETVFARLAAAFAQAGDRVIFAADHADGQPPDGQGLRHVALPAGHAAATRTLAAMLRAERPDASFSALGAQNLKHLAAAILARRLDRCVLGYHGFAIAEPRMLSRSSYWLAALATRLAARTICVSDALLDDMRHRWHASRRRTLRIYNPVMPVGGPTVPETPPLVVACGRLVAGKRFADLVEAFSAVRPDDARLVILGEGPERAAIEAAVASHHLGGRVDLPGHVDDPSIWYRRASCLAIASESESFGLTAAEALAHGVPVVTTACGGPGELLDHGRYGHIVPVGDARAMSSALTAALADPGDPAARVRHARAFALPEVHAAYAALADSLR